MGKNIRKVEPYVPGEQPKDKDIIKLNTNENPYPPAPHVKEVLESIRTEDFRKYPDPAADMLISAISENYGVDKNMIFTGVGSDDVLSMIFLTFLIRTVLCFSRYNIFFLQRMGRCLQN